MPSQKTLTYVSKPPEAVLEVQLRAALVCVGVHRVRANSGAVAYVRHRVELLRRAVRQVPSVRTLILQAQWHFHQAQPALAAVVARRKAAVGAGNAVLAELLIGERRIKVCVHHRRREPPSSAARGLPCAAVRCAIGAARVAGMVLTRRQVSDDAVKGPVSAPRSGADIEKNDDAQDHPPLDPYAARQPVRPHPKPRYRARARDPPKTSPQVAVVHHRLAPPPETLAGRYRGPKCTSDVMAADFPSGHGCYDCSIDQVSRHGGGRRRRTWRPS